MGITAISGPHVVYGITQTSTGGTTEYNEERGPSLFDLGMGMLDPRAQFNWKPGAAVGTPLPGVYLGARAEIDYVPAAAAANNLATTQAPGAGGSVVLTAGSGVTATTIEAPESGRTTGTLLCIDSTAATLNFGTSGTVRVWNPAAGAGRCVTITTNSSADGGSWTINGRDIYGYPMTETIATTGSTAGITSQKAFKYVSSVLAATTMVSTGVTVGVSNTYGLPLVARYTGVDLSINIVTTSSVVSARSSGPITVASTVTATSTTGDVRGTYASTTAANGTNRLQIVQHVSAVAAASVTATDSSAIFGVTQYSA